MREIFVIAWSWSRFLRRRLSVSHLRLVRSLLNWQSLFMQGKYSFNARRRSNYSNHIYFRSFSTLIAVYLMFHKSINVHADSMFMKSSSLSCWRLCLCIMFFSSKYSFWLLLDFCQTQEPLVGVAPIFVEISNNIERQPAFLSASTVIFSDLSRGRKILVTCHKSGRVC